MLIRWPRGTFGEAPNQVRAPFNSCTQPGCALLLVVVLAALLFPLIHAALSWFRSH